MREPGKSICLLAFGSMVETAVNVRENLIREGLKNVSLLNMRFAKPVDEKAVLEAANENDILVTMEENVYEGGIGQRILDIVAGMDKTFLSIALPDTYVEHGNVDLLKKEMGIDAGTITEKILNML